MGNVAGEVTRLLLELKEQKQDAAPRLFELLYGELRSMARRRLQNERPDHTLQATALVHEAYVRIAGNHQPLANRAHFFAIASSAMRRVLVDHARAKHAAKRPGSQLRVELEDAPLLFHERYDDLLVLDRALDRLGEIDARQVRIVELRYFGGLTAKETAEALNLSELTIHRDWAVAKAWLYGELSSRTAEP